VKHYLLIVLLSKPLRLCRVFNQKKMENNREMEKKTNFNYISFENREKKKTNFNTCRCDKVRIPLGKGSGATKTQKQNNGKSETLEEALAKKFL